MPMTRLMTNRNQYSERGFAALPCLVEAAEQQSLTVVMAG
jgi:hypothetical protein